MFDLLNGIRVLDLTSVLLGPYATQMLGDLGADVIKIESPDGDPLRYADAGRSEGMAAAYINSNRNKRSIVLDLKTGEGLQSLYRLIESADVVVHNMRPKAAAKLGLGFEDVRACKGDIVYCHACGFGQRGRLADEPAYDDTMQALCGLAYVNARADDDEPRYLPNVVCDKVAGLHLAVAVLAGVVARNRTRTGVCIETPMFESLVSFLFVEMLSGRSFDPPLGDIGYHRLTSAFRRPFRTRDGFVSIIPYSTRHWQRFLCLIGRPELAEDESVTDPARRSQQIDRLYQLIAEAAPRHTTAEWRRLLHENDIPCADVNRPEDLLNHPHLNEVGLFRPAVHPTEGTLLSMTSPFRIAGEQGRQDRHAPRLGHDGREILREAGYEDRDIERLQACGAVRLPH